MKDKTNYNGSASPASGKHNKRAFFNDYTEPHIYMFTIKKNPGIPDFSGLVGDPRIVKGVGAPNVEHSAIGSILYEELMKTERMRSGYIRIMKQVIMPDHAHILVSVLRKLQSPVTKIISSIESATTRRCRESGLIPADASIFEGIGVK